MTSFVHHLGPHVVDEHSLISQWGCRMDMVLLYKKVVLKAMNDTVSDGSVESAILAVVCKRKKRFQKRKHLDAR